MTSPPSPTSPPAEAASSPSANSKSTAFRFKRKRRHDSPQLSSHRSQSPSSRRQRHHHHHHRRHHRKKVSFSPPNTPPLSPNTAFRESLFDALADDEGADYWSRVYGQPIHTYSPYYHSEPLTNAKEAEQREMQRMTDDEYASYVRSKMWEKSHGYIVEERKKREEERKRKAEREEQGKNWERGVEEALRRGEERRKKRRWKEAWERYVAGWEQVKETGLGRMGSRIPWPVETGRYEDVGKNEIERFFHHAPLEDETASELSLTILLKAERVKWHPDKIQQKAGGGGLEEEKMKAVTATFQVIDRMWSETRAER